MHNTAVAFSRTMRSLQADRARGFLIAIAIVSLVIAGWAVWVWAAQVAVYAVSDTSRIETYASSVPIQSVSQGRIAASYLALGREVKRGETLVELEADVERLQVAEEQTQGSSLQAEVSTLQSQIAAEQATLQQEEEAARIGLDEARAKLQEAQAAWRYARMDAERSASLVKEGLAPNMDAQRSESEAQRAKAVVDGLALAISRQEREMQAHKSERQARIEELRRSIAQLLGQKTKVGAAVSRLRSQVKLRRIVAPIDGVIGELGNVRLGAVVMPGQQLGAIVPAGSLKVVAQFDPATALGRIREGQHARVRLQGFPWTQYGTIPATVSKVANEVREGRVRVDLTPAAGSRVPLQHGLPGTTEVEVEHLSPAALVLRLAGQMLTGPVPAEGRTE